jgi:hypothetical protein
MISLIINTKMYLLYSLVYLLLLLTINLIVVYLLLLSHIYHKVPILFDFST